MKRIDDKLAGELDIGNVISTVIASIIILAWLFGFTNPSQTYNGDVMYWLLALSVMAIFGDNAYKLVKSRLK